MSTIRPCSRSSCQHCQKRVAIFLIDGFGILRRRHEAKCPLAKVTPPATQAETTSETTTATAVLTGSTASSSSSLRPNVTPQESPGFWPRLMSSLRCGRRHRPAALVQRPAAVAAPAVGEVVRGGVMLEGDERTEVLREESHFKASPLLSTFRAVNLESGRSRFESVESTWLRILATKATFARRSVRAPPEGEGWSTPCEHSDSRWKMQLWYKWSAPTTISTLSRLKVQGSLSEVLSLFREADKVSNWLPFVTGGECTWSHDVPALVFNIEAKVPIVPRRFSTLIHRAFIDDADDTQTLPGVYIIEWTPPAEDVATGLFCGMQVPPTPPRSSAMQVNLSTTFVCPDPEQQDCCVIIMAGDHHGRGKRLWSQSKVDSQPGPEKVPDIQLQGGGQQHQFLPSRHGALWLLRVN